MKQIEAGCANLSFPDWEWLGETDKEGIRRIVTNMKSKRSSRLILLTFDTVYPINVVFN